MKNAVRPKASYAVIGVFAFALILVFVLWSNQVSYTGNQIADFFGESEDTRIRGEAEEFDTFETYDDILGPEVKDHSVMVSDYWKRNNHNVVESQLGHDVSLTQNWRQQGHRYGRTTDGHDIALSQDWDAKGHEYYQTREGHDITLTQDWKKKNHWYIMTKDGHDIALSQTWLNSSHVYERSKYWWRYNHDITLSRQWYDDHDSLVSLDWPRDDHDVTLSHRWNTEEHRYSTSRYWWFRGHDSNTTKTWDDQNHDFLSTQYWGRNNHTFSLSMDWRTKRHDVRRTLDDHDITLTQYWKDQKHRYSVSRLDHDVERSQTWIRDGHNLALSIQWDRDKHEIWLSKEWEKQDHEYLESRDWSRGKHDPALSREWLRKDHKYISTWQWQIGRHNFTTSFEWKRHGHKYWWTVDGHKIVRSQDHSTDLSREWEHHRLNLSYQWVDREHELFWSYDKHNTSLSKNWDNRGHFYDESKNGQPIPDEDPETSNSQRGNFFTRLLGQLFRGTNTENDRSLFSSQNEKRKLIIMLEEQEILEIDVGLQPGAAETGYDLRGYPQGVFDLCELRLQDYAPLYKTTIRKHESLELIIEELRTLDDEGVCTNTKTEPEILFATGNDSCNGAAAPACTAKCPPTKIHSGKESKEITVPQICTPTTKTVPQTCRCQHSAGKNNCGTTDACTKQTSCHKKRIDLGNAKCHVTFNYKCKFSGQKKQIQTCKCIPDLGS